MNNLTDIEIKKALECCGDKHKKCDNCPAMGYECIELERNALDLINRLQAKIKNFDEKTVIQRGMIDRQKAEIEALTDKLNATIAGQETLQKTLAEKSAEVERLKKRLHLAETCIDEVEDALYRGSGNDWAEQAVENYNNLLKKWWGDNNA